MTKVKDGFWKQLGSKVGSDDYLLKAAGGYIGVGNSSGDVVPLNNGTKNENLNADMVDGLHATRGNNKPWGTIPAITTSGWMDVGRQFEFHYDNDTGSDYSTVLRCTGNYGNIIDLPSTSGTLALKSDIPSSLPANGGNADTVNGIDGAYIFRRIRYFSGASNDNTWIKIQKKGQYRAGTCLIAVYQWGHVCSFIFSINNTYPTASTLAVISKDSGNLASNFRLSYSSSEGCFYFKIAKDYTVRIFGSETANGMLGTGELVTSTPSDLSECYNISINVADIARSVDWSSITNKPSSFTPSSHTHPDTFQIFNEENYVNLSFRDAALSQKASEKYIECWDSAGGWWNWMANKWIKVGSDDSYVLLGGGGHKALSDFSMSHNHPYLPLSGGWMDTGAQIYFKGLNQSTSVWGSIGYRAYSGNGNNVMHTVTSPNNTGALYITTNGYDSANDYGGLAIDNDGVTAFGAGDSGSVFRVINEDNVSDGAQFYVTKSSGAVVKRSLTASNFISNAATGTQPYACTSTTLNTNLNADLLDGLHEISFYRHRGSYGKSYTAASTEYNLGPGTYRTSEEGFSGTLLSFNSSGSASAIQFWTHYQQGNLYYRTSIDSNHWGKTNGEWTRILDSDSYNYYAPTLTGGGASGTWNISILGNADTLDNQHLITQVSDWNTGSLSIFKSSENSTSNAPTTDFIYGVTLRFHRDMSTYHTDLVASLYHDRLFFRRKTEEGYQTWRELIHSGNYTSYLDERYYTETEADNRFVNVTGDSMSGALSIQTQAKTKSSPMSQQLVINGPNYNSSDSINLQYFPGIGFHLPGRTWASLIWNGYFTGVNSDYSGYVGFYGSGFTKDGSSDNYFLLGGGGHTATSNYSLSTHTHTFNLGSTTITTNGSSYSGITGPFNIYTNASSSNAFAICRNSLAEGVQHWVDDGQYHIDYTNDETASAIHIRIINTDIESGNKTNTTDYHYYLDCYGSFHPGSNNTGSIGTAGYKWANMYATTFHGSLDGNASTATSATSATKLQTSRKLWSQPFDGTADVNGQIDIIINKQNSSTVVPTSSAIMLGSNGSGHTGYHAGIAFNALRYNPYVNHIHAWIGLGPYTTTAAAECYPLVFATNGSITTGDAPTERMRITPSGDIGIGITNPAYKLEVGGSICGDEIYTNRGGSSTKGGVSLYYNSDPMNYGIAFRGTGTYGIHGFVTSANDWATYLTMSDDLTRGWIFRRGSTNVASIAGSGNMAIGQHLKFSNEAHISTNRSTDYHYGYTFNLGDNAKSIGMYSGPAGEAGGVVISPDGCLIYNSSDCGYNLQVRDKDLGGDLTNIDTLTFGIEQSGYYTWSRGGFKKNGSDDSYVLLGGGGHKAESGLSVNYANSAGTTNSLGSGALKYMCSLYATSTYNAYKITTDWHKSSNIMPTINIRGYAYGSERTIDCDIVMYHYNNTACNYSLTNKGSYPIRVWQAIENDVQVFYINPGEYFGMFNVFVYGGIGTDAFSNWSMTTVDSVSGTEIGSVPIATSITGNADTVDNMHASNFSYNVSSGNYDCNNLPYGTHSATYRFSGSPLNAFPNSSWSNMLVIGAGSDTMTQIGAPYDADELYFRRGTWDSGGGSIRTNEWKAILHSGNYTSYAASASHTHSYLEGTYNDVQTQPLDYGLYYTAHVNYNTIGTPATSDNSNGIISLNRHPGNYWSQIGLGSDGRIKYRSYSATAISSDPSRAWNTLAYTSEIPTWDTLNGKPFNWSGQSGQPTWLWGSNDGTNYYVWNPSNFSVNYANSAGSADYADSAESATQATNLTPENTAHYFRDPNNSTWRGGMIWGSAGSESMSFVVANSGTRFQFVGGSDIASWTSSTWQDANPYLTIYSNGIVTPGSATASGGFIKSGYNDNYVLLAGGGHKAESDLSVSYASSAGSVNYANSAGSAERARYLTCPDTRSSAPAPGDYTATSTGVSFDFKESSVTGLSGYSGVMTVRPYASGQDWTGGEVHQIAFLAGGGLYHRIGTSSWDSWERILTSSNWSSYISIPSVGNGTVTITQAGSTIGSFTMNQSGNTIIALNDTNTDYYPIRSYTSGLQISSYSGSTDCALFVPYATANQAGVVSTETQTFSGEKTFSSIRLRSTDTVNFGGYLYFGDGSYAYLAELADDQLTLNATKIFLGISGSQKYYIDGTIFRPVTANSTSSSGIALGSSDYRFTCGYFSDKVYAYKGFYESSDERLKNILNPVKVNLDDLSKLRKVYYLWKDRTEDEIQLGMIAQDVQKLYPELVSVDKETGYLSLAYDKLSVLALEAIDVLYKEHKKLKKHVDELEKLLINNKIY